jgi:hypothetical protein
MKKVYKERKTLYKLHIFLMIDRLDDGVFIQENWET